MTLEEIVYSVLAGSRALASALTSYNGKPAVFYGSAPDDKADGWDGRTQFPRIDYTADYVSNPERKTSGVLAVNIMCAEDGVLPEEIEPLVRNLLCGVFLTPSGGIPHSLAWARSEAYDRRREDGDGIVTGISVLFDLYAFPAQVTTDPDPVLAMNRFAEVALPDAEIIGGRKPTAEVFVPTPERPAIYFRLESLQTERETNTVAWLDGVVAGHVFAGGEETIWIKRLADRLAEAGEVEMLDTSPMFMRTVRADNTLDALSAGQLRLSVRFGILRRPGYHHPLMRPYGNTKPLFNAEATQS